MRSEASQYSTRWNIFQVRGVGAGGIVSTAYCLLYKLYTLRLTRKQLNGLLNHTDSPFIRALGRYGTAQAISAESTKGFHIADQTSHSLERNL